MDWLRLYNSVLDNPKVQRLPGGLFKTWINLLCLASGAQVRGTLPELADCAWRLRTDEAAMRDALTDLEGRGLIDVTDDGRWAIHDWSEYQYESDTSTGRVQKHRAKKREEQERSNETLPETLPETEGNVSVTAQNRTEQIQTRADTDQTAPAVAADVRAKKMKQAKPYTPEFESWWATYPKKGDTKSTAFEVWDRLPDDHRALAESELPRWLPYYASIENRLIPDARTWLNQSRWENEPPPPERPNLTVVAPQPKRMDDYDPELYGTW